MGQSLSTSQRPRLVSPRLSEASQLTVIVPALNEADNIEQAIQSVYVPGTVEQPQIIVVDGGSSDETVAKSRHANRCIVISSSPGRGLQLKTGAELADRDWLLFLHADSTLPDNYFVHMVKTLNAPQRGPFWDISRAYRPWRSRGEQRDDQTGSLSSHQWGCFSHIQTGDDSTQVVSWGVRARTNWLAMPYGDQALFFSKAAYQAVHGFNAWPLLEDVDMVKRVKAMYGRPAIVPLAVKTSPRRWQKLGVVRTTMINQGILMAYFFGVPTDVLAAWYNAARTTPDTKQ